MQRKKPFRHQIYQDSRWLTISNLLTVSRIFLAPVIMVGIFLHAWSFTFFIFIVASITDLLDGFFARYFNEKTHLGTLLDPIADKFFLVCCFFALSLISSPSFQIPVWFFVLELVREGTILLGTYFLMRSDSEFEVQPTLLGKFTTFFQLLFISWLFICHFFHWYPIKTFSIAIIVLAVFSVMSLLHYIKIGFCYFISYKRNLFRK